jgi:hypothetical protein
VSAKKSRRTGKGAAAGRKLAGCEPITPEALKRKALDSGETLAHRWLHVTPTKKEVWYHDEPRDVAVMEVKFLRLLDGTVWQVVARHRVKLHDRFNTELFPPPWGRGWQFAGPGYICMIYMRPASAKLLRKLKVKP